MVVSTLTGEMEFIKELNMFIQGTATLLEKLLTKGKEHSHNVFQVTRRSRNEVKPFEFQRDSLNVTIGEKEKSHDRWKFGLNRC